MPETLVDPERAAEFLERLGAQASADQFQQDSRFAAGQAAMETAASSPESWQTFAAKSVDFTAVKICPAWELTADEKGQLSLSVAEVLDHYFPGAVAGFDGWSPWAKLAGTLFFVAALRIDLNTWRFAPLHSKGKSDADGEPAGRPVDIDDGQDALGENAAHFTIGRG